jgi:hypothetical protein
MGILPQPARRPERNLTMVNPRTKSWGRIAETLGKKKGGKSVKLCLFPNYDIRKKKKDGPEKQYVSSADGLHTQHPNIIRDFFVDDCRHGCHFGYE